MTDQPITSAYPSPVDQLLTRGRPEDTDTWPDYLGLGFSEQHVPDLIRMALDPALNFADPERVEVWAPLHAWRTLGQLRAQVAIEPLLALFHMFQEQEGSDWIADELPEVYALIGASAIPALAAYILDDAHGEYPRADAAVALKKIAEAHPDFRADCVAAIVAALEKYESNGESLNALVISDLVDLKAVEALPTIEKAFAANKVDLMVQGDWEDVQMDMGVLEARVTKRRPLVRPELLELFEGLDEGIAPTPVERNMIKSSKAKTKAKRKQAEKSRKINRKKRK